MRYDTTDDYQVVHYINSYLVHTYNKCTTNVTHIGIEYFTSQEHELESIRQELGASFLGLLQLQTVLFRGAGVGGKFLDFRFHFCQFLCNQFGSFFGMKLAINVRHLSFGGVARHHGGGCWMISRDQGEHMQGHGHSYLVSCTVIVFMSFVSRFQTSNLNPTK